MAPYVCTLDKAYCGYYEADNTIYDKDGNGTTISSDRLIVIDPSLTNDFSKVARITLERAKEHASRFVEDGSVYYVGMEPARNALYSKDRSVEIQPLSYAIALQMMEELKNEPYYCQMLSALRVVIDNDEMVSALIQESLEHARDVIL